MIKFPSINQYRNAIKSLQQLRKHGKLTDPLVLFVGTVKLHGTNAGVVMDLPSGKINFQSRENVITPEKDNAGFAAWGTANIDVFRKLFSSILYLEGPLAEGTRIAVFGEWCGGSIQKGVALNSLPKMFVVFNIALVTGEGEDQKRVWLSEITVQHLVHYVRKNDLLSVYDVPEAIKYVYVNVDLPQEAQNQLASITEAVEAECPMGKMFGVCGVGEGMVWRPMDSTLPSDTWFKVKGEKHSVSKVKTLASVDPELVASIREFVEYVVTENRLQQGFDLLEVKSVEKTGDFLKWVTQDIIKEENDTLVANELQHKDVMKAVSQRARQWFMIKLNSDL